MLDRVLSAASPIAAAAVVLHISVAVAGFSFFLDLDEVVQS
ncbi:hypothetical protein ABZ413_11415 [Nocardia rhamnosiphila]